LHEDFNVKKIKILDLFSGVGGFVDGAIKAGKTSNFEVEHVALCEIDKDCQKILRMKYKDIKIYDDVKTLDTSDMEFDLICFGAPCQAFSRNGKGYNYGKKIRESDDRANLILYVVNILKRKQPKAFILENVKEILTIMTPDKKELFKTVLMDIFDEAGYNVAEPQIISPSDLGIPQQRKRAFFVGIRKDLKKTFEFPALDFSRRTSKNNAIYNFLEKNVDKKYYLENLWENRYLNKSLKGLEDVKDALIKAVKSIKRNSRKKDEVIRDFINVASSNPKINQVKELSEIIHRLRDNIDHEDYLQQSVFDDIIKFKSIFDSVVGTRITALRATYDISREIKETGNEILFDHLNKLIMSFSKIKAFEKYNSGRHISESLSINTNSPRDVKQDINFQKINRFIYIANQSSIVKGDCELLNLLDTIKTNYHDDYFLQNNLLETLLKFKDKTNKIIEDRINNSTRNYNICHWITENNENLFKVSPIAIIYGDTPSKLPRQQDKVYSRYGWSPTIATFSTPAIDDTDGWRLLTPRECFNLQSFDENHPIPSQDAKAYKQAGNAVNVTVVSELIKKLYETSIF